MAGYYTDTSIATVYDPNLISSASQPNFVQIMNIGASNRLMSISLSILAIPTQSQIDNGQTKITIVNGNGLQFVFEGTSDPNKIDSTHYYIDLSLPQSTTAQQAIVKAIIAENLRITILSNSFFQASYSINIPPIIDGSNIYNGNILYFTSVEAGINYNWDSYTTGSSSLLSFNDYISSQNNDSIDIGNGNTDVEIDMYVNTGVFLGEDDFPRTSYLGEYVATLSKHYVKDEIWFETNSLPSKSISIQPDWDTLIWFNADSYQDYRFIIKVYDGKERRKFYISPVQYILEGNIAPLEKNFFYRTNGYVYDTLSTIEKIKPLTTQLERNIVYTKDKEINIVLSFILSDSQHTISSLPGFSDANFNIGIKTSTYTHTGQLISSNIGYSVMKSNLFPVNTINLNYNNILDDRIDYITIEITGRNDAVISKPLKLNLIKTCEHYGRYYSFLNELGGWDNVCFFGDYITENDTSKDSIYKTLTPEYTKSSSYETVNKNNIDQSFKINTGWNDINQMDLYKQLSYSKYVYENETKRYIIVDKFKIELDDNNSRFNCQMQYHYSDTPNGEVK